MDWGARNRLKLWLRSERALGLPSVVVPGGAIAAQQVTGSASHQVADECGVEDCGSATSPAPPPVAPVVLPPTDRRQRDEPDTGSALFAPAAEQDSPRSHVTSLGSLALATPRRARRPAQERSDDGLLHRKL